MTISSTQNRVPYTGNGVTTNFAFPYLFLANADLKVYENGLLRTLGTHYTVSGAGNPAGGTVAFVTPPAKGVSIVILNDPPITQTTDLEDNDSLPAEALERALDRLTIIAQRLSDRLNRAAVLPDSYAGSASPVLPAPVAGRALKWNGTATAFVNSDNDPDAVVATAQSHANAAADSATAAANSAAAAAASYDSFDDRYLGAKASDPTTDNDGQPLLTGALYWNTTTGAMRAYNGAVWVELPAATNWGPSRTLTIGNTGKSVDGSADVSWSLVEIVGGGIPATALELGSGVDFNTIQTPGFYVQSQDTEAATGTNYPIPRAGALTVLKNAIGVTQIYCPYGGYSGLFIRAIYSGSWSTWREVAFLDAPAFTSATFSGNVGIGTSSPGARLDVAGDARVRYAAGGLGSVGITLGNLSASSTLTGNYHIDFSNEQDIPVAHIWSSVYGDGSSRLAFGTTPAGSRTADRRQTNMWLSPDGLWVGSTDSTVAHVLAVDGISNGGVGYISVGHTSGVTNGNWYHAFRYGNSVIGTITQASTSSVAYNTTSDRRLKTNIAPAPDAGPVIDGIEVVSHDWKAGGHTRFGVIAQDLHTVYPEAVTPGDDSDEGQVEHPWSVDYSKLVPLLVKEVQSLRARVAALEAKEEA